MIDEENPTEEIKMTDSDASPLPPSHGEPQDRAPAHDTPEVMTIQDAEAASSENSQGEVDPPATLDDLEISDDEISAVEAEQEATERAETEVLNSAIVSDLKREIESLKLQLEERSGLYVRLNADFDNFRKRTQNEREELEVRIKGNTLRELLPVVDNFERARSHIKPQTDVELNIHKSYQGIYKLLVDCLKRLGVSPMRPEGQPFDPNLHEAVMREPTADKPEDTVLEELQRGYLLGDRVLRHAMVKVAAPGDGIASDPEPSEADTSEN